MNIGIVLRRLHTRGGTERRTAELIRGLLEAGHKVHLFAEAWEKELGEALVCHRIPTLKAARWLKALSFAVFAARATRRESLDLVHSQARTYADDVATLGGGCHADYLEHFVADMPPLRRAWERNHPFNRVTMALEKAQYRRCSRIILNSHFAQRGLVRYFPWAEAKCRVAHNSVDSEFFAPNTALRAELRGRLGISENTIVFLFVGSGFERKGVPEFMQALAIAKKQHLDSALLGLVVGKGDFPRYDALAKKMGIWEEMFFAGAASDPRPYYCAADVFVLPTKFDPFANTTNEALACGLPVITTRTNGGCEVVDEKVGYVVEQAGDVEGIAAAMGELLDKDRRMAMSAAARQNAILRPWSETTRKTLEVYQEILSERGHPN